MRKKNEKKGEIYRPEEERKAKMGMVEEEEERNTVLYGRKIILICFAGLVASEGKEIKKNDVWE